MPSRHGFAAVGEGFLKFRVAEHPVDEFQIGMAKVLRFVK